MNTRLPRLTNNVFLLALACVLLPACTSNSPKDSTSVTISSNNKTNNDANIYNAKYQTGINDLKSANYTESEKIFSELVKENPTKAGPYSNLAIIYYKANDFDNALKLVNHAIEINNSIAQAYNLRAQIYIKKGDIKAAEADYQSAIKLKPDYINAQYNLALLYDIYLQDVKMAISHYDIYLSLIKEPDTATKEWVDHLKGSLNNG